MNNIIDIENNNSNYTNNLENILVDNIIDNNKASKANNINNLTCKKKSPNVYEKKPIPK